MSSNGEVPGPWAVVGCRLDKHLPGARLPQKSFHPEPQYVKQMGVGLLCVGEESLPEPELHPVHCLHPHSCPEHILRPPSTTV